MGMSQGKVQRLITATEAALKEAEGYLGTHNASSQELAALERHAELRDTGSCAEIIENLILLGELQGCPRGFWKALLKAATLGGSCGRESMRKLQQQVEK
jgi:hypothetical protein